MERHARRRGWILVAAVLVAALLGGSLVFGHPMDERNSSFVRGVEGAAVGPFVYLGAKHMATGLDHILFLVGVIFFLRRPRDVVVYVSLFTIGHSITLLAGVLAGLRVDPYLIDAVIGLSVAYKGFENIGGFERWRLRPSTRGAVLVFGLFHGLGLATKLQDFTSGGDGLVTNIISFNVGVEIGQILALSLVLVALVGWRSRPSFARHAFATNAVLMALGFTLAGYQIVGSLLY